MKTYLGKPCARGHDGTRYVSTRGCVACIRDRTPNRVIPSAPTPAKHPITGKPMSGKGERIRAVSEGRQFYHGRACDKAGHGTLRYTNGSECVACRSEANQRAYAPRRKRQVEPTAYELEMLRWAAILV